MFNKLPVENIKQLSSLLEIKQHQVISRAIIKGEETLVTIFALDGEEISEERYMKDCMYYVLEGQTTITTETNSYTLQAGDYIVFEKGTLHALTNNQQLKYLQILS